MENLYFETGKAELQSESHAELNRLVYFMLEHRDFGATITGHTDNIGSKLHNLNLSENRAKVVVDYLIFQGIDSSRLSFFGKGLAEPIASNNTGEGRARNRRVEFTVIKK